MTVSGAQIMSSTAAFASPSGLGTDPAGLRPLSGIADMRGGGMPQARVRQILADLVVAVSALHAQGRVHGGISMDTVVRGEADPVRLRDPLGELVPNGEDTLRRPGFAPFEQYTDDPGSPCGPWTDVYALSALAYALITGAAPPDALSRRVRDAYVPLAGLALRGYDPAFLEGLDASLSMIAALRPQSLEAYDDLLMLPVPTPVAIPAPVAVPVVAATDAAAAGAAAGAGAEAVAGAEVTAGSEATAGAATAAGAEAAFFAAHAASAGAAASVDTAPVAGAATDTANVDAGNPADLDTQATAAPAPSSAAPSAAAAMAAPAASSATPPMASPAAPSVVAPTASSVPPAVRDKSRRASGMGIALVVAILAVAGFLWLKGDEPPTKVASNATTPGSASPAQNQAGQGSTQQNVGQATAGQASPASTAAGQNAAAQAQPPDQAGASPMAGTSTDATPSGPSPFAGMSADHPQGSTNSTAGAPASMAASSMSPAGTPNAPANVAAGSTDLPAAPSSSQPAIATATLNGAKPIPDHRTAPGAATQHDPQATAPAMNSAASAPTATSASAASSSPSAASPAAAPATASAAASSAGTVNGAAMASATPTAPTPAPAPKAPVTVNVNIQPWGEVIVDGKSRGISPPLRELKLPPGKHSVVVQNAGLPPYRITLDLTEGRGASISHVFQ